VIDDIRRDLVIANRILVRHNIVDAFGHVSVRHPSDPTRFLMSKRVPPGLVEMEDIREFGMNGNLVEDSMTRQVSFRRRNDSSGNG
jgi:ribulose-5-phosphate 4-epimerase/fuculose-1-phosphate aldolase